MEFNADTGTTSHPQVNAVDFWMDYDGPIP